MSDILKFIHDNSPVGNDPHGNLLGLQDWSEALAADMAADEGLTLNDEHYAVLHQLREIYRDHKDSMNARQITLDLERAFKPQGGRRYLYRLFPRGPVSTGCRLAGLPMPANSHHPSFGVAH